jgi:hypothetical protein
MMSDGNDHISRRRAGLDEEQALCSEALTSGIYDRITDAAWIRLCEEVAAASRGIVSPPVDSDTAQNNAEGTND